MHKLAEKIADCMKAKVEGIGIDNIEGQNLVEFELWSKIIKNLVCYDKDKKIIEAMDEAEDSKEAMKYIEMYENYPEEGRKGYRGQPRNSKGQYMSRGGRRGYEEQMYYTMTPEMYREHDPEYYRDMDRESGKMYYSSGNMGGQSSSGMSGGSQGGSRGYSESGSQGRDSREGRSGQSRRSYMESKEMGKDKGEKMKSLEEYMKSIAEDITEAIEGASPEERSMTKQKLQMIAQKM